ncbi:hypothetical protein JBE04_03030 [Streptomyces sp. PRKS01-29]|nr:hypothetical protein [Streptomyces sabulosicollis]MBI0293488.1 hypothetical protein [Streptomyces sabulosicollis]
MTQAEFARFAAREGWWYSGSREHEWFGSAHTWDTVEGLVVRFYPGGPVPVPFAEVSADEPEMCQRAMADAEAAAVRAFPCFSVADCLSLARSASGGAVVRALNGLATVVPDRYSRAVGELVIPALFAPEPSVRTAALRVVKMAAWPEFVRPLAAAALTEPDEEAARLARDIVADLSKADVLAFLVRPSADEEPTAGTGHRSDDDARRTADQGRRSRKPGSAQEMFVWTP